MNKEFKENSPNSIVQQGNKTIGRKLNNNRVEQKSLFGQRALNPNRSIAQRIGNWFTDITHLTSPPTFQDGYGRTLNAEVPITESAQGQELERMKDTAKKGLMLASIPMLGYGFWYRPVATAFGLGAGSATYGLTKGALNGVDKALNKKYNLSLNPKFKNTVSFLASLPVGSTASKYGDNVTRRGLELIMHHSSARNPIPEVQHWWKASSSQGKQDALKYAFTGKGQNFLENWDKFPAYKGIGNQGGGIVRSWTSEESAYPDMVRTYLYGEPIKGFTEVKNPDYGIHENYIFRKYPRKNIKVYEANELSHETYPIEKPLNINNYDTRGDILFKDAFGRSLEYDADGHYIQRGEIPGWILERHQDIWKFNPSDYWKRWIRPYSRGFIKNLPLMWGLNVVDHYGTPVIVRTPWYKLQETTDSL